MDERKLIEQKLFNDTSKYDDIMDFPYEHPKRHLPMPQIDRAAQFAPFGALAGFGDMIKQKTKDYAQKRYPTEEQEQQIVRQIEYLKKHPELIVDVNYFNEESGYYEHIQGKYKKQNKEKGRVTFDSKNIIQVHIRTIKLVSKINQE
ncbi:hypothetical protein EFO98_15375 [Lactiplantibacillus argentoratensis]|uniref:hypothetical protein n=1 Tax=Lactiplantibacillus argentoratensis TaxID=271881 RepID=UPI0021AA41D8|nr:hypothetical protein [Lactiplantibacillus argentoratensis]MCT4445072.1 hypothetical protein [Lactiplantibacillus argentoratensis]